MHAFFAVYRKIEKKNCQEKIALNRAENREHTWIKRVLVNMTYIYGQRNFCYSLTKSIQHMMITEIHTS